MRNSMMIHRQTPINKQCTRGRTIIPKGLPFFHSPPPIQQYEQYVKEDQQRPMLPSAPSLAFEASFTDFTDDVKAHKIPYVALSQDLHALKAINSDGYQEVITLPPNFNIVEFLMKYDVRIDMVKESKGFGEELISFLLIFFQFTIGFVFLRALFGGFGGGPGGGLGGIKGFTQNQSKVDVNPNTKTTFNDIAGIENAKRDLQEVVDFLKNPERYSKVGAKVPRGVILHGPPGTGKTLLAKAVAGEAGVPFIACSGSDFIEMFVGVGASRIRDLFKKASENAPCIVFIDEIDSIGKKRGASPMQGGNDERDNTINALLTLMDGFEENTSVILLAATNRFDLLDEALLRPGRFDRHVMVELPDLRGREAILRIHTRNKPVDPDINLKSLAQTLVGFSGADIQNLTNEAAIYAARNNSEVIQQKHFDLAFEKIVLGEEKRTLVITEQKKKVLAYHEAGHALLGLLMKDYDTVRKVSIIPRGKIGGATYFEPSEERVDMSLLTKEYLENKMVVALGGRVAEEIAFGNDNATTGASGDFQEVYKLAYHAIAMFGFNQSLGPVHWGPESQNHEKINEEIVSLVKKQYVRAKKLLNDNNHLLVKLADALMTKETLDEKEIRECVGM